MPHIKWFLSQNDNWIPQTMQTFKDLWHSALKRTAECHKSALHIWARNVALEWNPAPAILHRESPCLKCHIFLTCNLRSVKYIRGRLFRLIQNSTSMVSVDTRFSWHYPFNTVKNDLLWIVWIVQSPILCISFVWVQNVSFSVGHVFIYILFINLCVSIYVINI
jgi:hypothetical protein